MGLSSGQVLRLTTRRTSVEIKTSKAGEIAFIIINNAVIINARNTANIENSIYLTNIANIKQDSLTVIIDIIKCHQKSLCFVLLVTSGLRSHMFRVSFLASINRGYDKACGMIVDNDVYDDCIIINDVIKY